MLSDPQTGALALAKSKMTLASFSRAQEFEADGIGVGISARAGFDPFGASRFLTDMERNADLKPAERQRHPHVVDFLSTHPATPDRVRNALANARQFSGPGAGERDRGDYLAALNGLIYGEDPSEGFVRGRRFLHPKLGFTFMAPPGFTLDNTAQAVLGLKDGGGEAMRLDVVSVPAEQSLPDYLKSGWMENVEPQASRNSPSTVSRRRPPRPRATMVVPAVCRALRQRRLPLHLRGQEHDAAVRPLLPRVDHDLPPHEPEGEPAVKPLHIKIVNVGARDTVEALARRMAIDHALSASACSTGSGPTTG